MLKRSEAKKQLDQLYHTAYSVFRKEPLETSELEKMWNEIKYLEDVFFLSIKE